MKRTICILTLVVLFSVCFASCNKYDTYPQPTYLIAMSTNMPPYSYVDTADDGTIVQKGIDYDALLLVAKQQNIKYKIILDTWVNCLSKVKAGNVDACWSNLSITAEREETLDFLPYYEENLSIGTLASRTDITTLDDLNGKTVVVIPNSIGCAFAHSIEESLNLSILEIGDYNQRYNSVANGEADAIFEDYSILAIAIRDYFPTLKVAGVTGESAPLGIAVPKGRNAELLKAFEAGLNIIKDNKRWDSILNKHLN